MNMRSIFVLFYVLAACPSYGAEVQCSKQVNKILREMGKPELQDNKAYKYIYRGATFSHDGFLAEQKPSFRRSEEITMETYEACLASERANSVKNNRLRADWKLYEKLDHAKWRLQTLERVAKGCESGEFPCNEALKQAVVDELPLRKAALDAAEAELKSFEASAKSYAQLRKESDAAAQRCHQASVRNYELSHVDFSVCESANIYCKKDSHKSPEYLEYRDADATYNKLGNDILRIQNAFPESKTFTVQLEKQLEHAQTKLEAARRAWVNLVESGRGKEIPVVTYAKSEVFIQTDMGSVELNTNCQVRQIPKWYCDSSKYYYGVCESDLNHAKNSERPGLIQRIFGTTNIQK